MNILDVHHLSKHYKQLIAVNDISFSVRQGVCLGLLGPNGAGKTTTIEMIEGLITPSSGEILYRGKPRQADFSQRVGIQFQQTALMDFLSVEETLKLFARFYQSSLPLEKLVELCQLQEFYHRDATKLSGGQRQRLLLAMALVNDPDLLFLDEPTTGLDPQARRQFWQLVEDIKKQGKTVILTTHYMDEAEKLCDDLLIIDHGEIIDQGAPRALLAKHFPYTELSLPLADFAEALQRCPFIVQQAGDSVHLQVENVADSLHWLLNENVRLDALRVRQANLEDLFIKLTGHRLSS